MNISGSILLFLPFKFGLKVIKGITVNGDFENQLALEGMETFKFIE